MKQRPRIYYTQTQKALMWERWKKGESGAFRSQWARRCFVPTHASIVLGNLFGGSVHLQLFQFAGKRCG